MSKKRAVDVEALICEEPPVIEAIRRGNLEVMKRHIQAGVPMVSWKGGQVIKIPPEELVEMLKAAETESPPR